MVVFLEDATFVFLLPKGHMSSAQRVYCLLKNKPVKGMGKSSKSLTTPRLRPIQDKMGLFFPSCSSWRPSASVGCGKGREPELPGAFVGSGSEQHSSLTGSKKAEDGKSWAEDEPKRGWPAVAQMSKHTC